MPEENTSLSVLLEEIFQDGRESQIGFSTWKTTYCSGRYSNSPTGQKKLFIRHALFLDDSSDRTFVRAGLPVNEEMLEKPGDIVIEIDNAFTECLKSGIDFGNIDIDNPGPDVVYLRSLHILLQLVRSGLVVSVCSDKQKKYLETIRAQAVKEVSREGRMVRAILANEAKKRGKRR